MMNQLSADNSEFVQQLIERVIVAYASCHSYMDEGEVNLVFVSKDGSEKFRSTRPFSTAFVRPDDFRFEFRNRYREDSQWNCYIVWQSGESILTHWSVEPGVETSPSLSLALAGATGVSGGSAVTIPNLLMPDTVKCNGILSITNWEFISEEAVGNAMTSKVHGTGPSYQGRDGRLRQRELTLCVDTQTMLVLQIFETLQIEEDLKAENTTVYRPQMNITIEPDKLSFAG